MKTSYTWKSLAPALNDLIGWLELVVVLKLYPTSVEQNPVIKYLKTVKTLISLWNKW